MYSSITTKLIIAAAQKREWTVNTISLKHEMHRITPPNGKHHYIRNNKTDKSSSITSFISSKKDIVYDLAHELEITFPATIIYRDIAQALSFLGEHKKLVVKPADNSHGTGVTININDKATLERGLQYAKNFSDCVLIQQQITGGDYRLLMIDEKLAAAAIREPAFVVGDGRQTVAQLIKQENTNPLRGMGYQNQLTLINTEEAERYLGSALMTIPALNMRVRVMGTANIGMGGVSIDVTDTVNPAIIAAAQKIVSHLHMGLCGVDFIVSHQDKAYLIEINAFPSFGLHEFPYQGIARNTPDKFLDWLTK